MLLMVNDQCTWIGRLDDIYAKFYRLRIEFPLGFHVYEVVVRDLEVVPPLGINSWEPHF